MEPISQNDLEEVYGGRAPIDYLLVSRDAPVVNKALAAVDDMLAWLDSVGLNPDHVRSQNFERVLTMERDRPVPESGFKGSQAFDCVFKNNFGAIEQHRLADVAGTRGTYATAVSLIAFAKKKKADAEP